MTTINYKPAGQFEETRYEKIHNVIVKDSIEGSLLVAQEIADLIRDKQALDQHCVLGLATGSSPIKVYEELIRMHREDGLSFRNVVTFNLDEYYPMEKDSHHSYFFFMHQHLFNHIDIKPENIHIPNGLVPIADVQQYCIDYDQKMIDFGGLDLQLLGIGRTGHVGFNEPGSHYNSGTRSITLDHITKVDAAPSFLGIDNVPKKAITMGIETVRNAKRIILLGWGSNKAAILQETIEGNISSDVPATYLQNHKNTSFIIDKSAAEELTRIKTPWLVGSCVWNKELREKAIVWLCHTTKKSILKLLDSDYNEYGMSDLLSLEGSSYDLNIQMFNKLQHSITGWPGGKPNADDSSRPERAEPRQKRVLIFSPHPGDAVISMGGTIDRLVEQGHEVHIAYQTSGNIAVSDNEALKYAEILDDMSPDNKGTEHIIKTLNLESDHISDSSEIRNLKGLIRKREAISTARFLKVSEKNIHFLNLPFYETGTIKKNPLQQVDIDITAKLIEDIKPHQLYISGDLADPHGTHKTCQDVLMDAFKKLKPATFMKDCWIWIYKGSWHEWEINQIDMAVPMSPYQVLKKRKAIFFHQSQKDGVMFQGNDTRAFWVRAEDKNTQTAKKYHKLGLADYEALEVFTRYKF